MFNSKNFILFFIFLASVFSEFLLTNLRYSNQDMMLDNYSVFMSGNIITGALTLILIVFLFLNLFSGKKYRTGVLVFLLFASILDLIILLFSYSFSEKDKKVIVFIAYFLIKLYITVSFIILFFSSSKKVHLLNNLGYMTLFLLISFSVVLFKVYNFTDDSESYKQGQKKADAGVILGAAVWGGNRPSPVLRERINKGFEIYQQKYVSKLILTGGGSPNELTEAEVSKNELIKYGVDPRNLLVEAKSNSTNEQIHYVKDKYYARFSYKKVILISDNFHLFRAKEICRFNGINADAFSSDTPLSTESYFNFCIKETFAVLLFWLFGLG